MPRDPFEFPGSNIFGRDPFAAAFPARRKQAEYPVFNPQEEEGILSNVGSRILSGLGWVGETLDKPGSAVRGLIAGQPEQLLNLIPFSDTLGITDPTTRVSGRDLLEKAGLLGANEEGLDWGDVAGFGAEVALDPFLFTGFGKQALTAEGRAAKAAGTLQKGVGKRIAAKQGGLINVGLPWTEGVTLGTGPGSQAFADWLGKGVDWLKFAPGIRNVRGLFSTKAGDSAIPEFQRAFETSHVPAAQAGEEAAYGADIATRRAAAGAKLLGTPEEEYIRATVEMGLTPEDILAKTGGTNVPAIPGQGVPPDVAALRTRAMAAQGIGSQIGKELAQQHDEFLDLGLDVAKRPNYFPRQRLGTARQRQTWFSSMAEREDIFEGLPAMTVEKIVKDDVIRNPRLEKPEILAHIQKRYGVGEEQAKQLADYIPTVPEGQYYGNALDDLRAYRLNAAKTKAAAKFDLDFLADSARSRGEILQTGATPVRLSEALKNAGFRYNEYAKKATAELAPEAIGPYPFAGPAIPGAPPRAAIGIGAAPEVRMGQVGPQTGLPEVLAKKTATRGAERQILDRLSQKFGFEVPSLDDWWVDRNFADQVARHIGSHTSTDAVKPVIQAFDKLSNFWKKSVLFRPAYFVRNMVGDAYKSLVAGALSPKAYVDASKMMVGKELPNLLELPGLKAAGATNAREATDMVADAIYQYGAFRPQAASRTMADVVGGITENIPVGIPGTAGHVPMPGRPTLPGKWFENWFQGANKTQQMTEFLGRASHVLERLKQGYSLREAALSAKATLGDYANLTRFERQVVRRLVPFYTYSRLTIPWTLEHLAERPGGAIAQTVRGTQAAGEGEYIPEYLRGGVAIPLGTEKEGQRQFLSSFGLPIEDVFSRVQFGPHGFRRTVEELASEMNPLLKAPAELFTGRQFFSGRELRDLYPFPTGNYVMDQAIANLPFSQIAGIGRTLLDERKGPLSVASNLLSGVKLTDVDVNKMRQADARQLVDDLLDQTGMRQFPGLHLPAKDTAATPDERLLLRLERTLNQRAIESSLEKKAQAGDEKAKRQLVRIRRKRENVNPD